MKKVKCVSYNTAYTDNLTYGKIYDVLQHDRIYINIINDIGEILEYRLPVDEVMPRFIELSKYRTEIINKILK